MELFLIYLVQLPAPPSFQSDCCCWAAHLLENYTHSTVWRNFYANQQHTEKWKIIFCCRYLWWDKVNPPSNSYKASFKNDLEPKTQEDFTKKEGKKIGKLLWAAHSCNLQQMLWMMYRILKGKRLLCVFWQIYC